MSVGAVRQVHEQYPVLCYAPPGGYQLDPDRHGLDIDPNLLGAAGEVILWRAYEGQNTAMLTTDVAETEGVRATVCLTYAMLSGLGQAMNELLHRGRVETFQVDVYDEDGYSGPQVHIGRVAKGQPVFLRTVLPDERVDVSVWLDPHGLAELVGRTAVMALEL